MNKNKKIIIIVSFIILLILVVFVFLKFNKNDVDDDYHNSENNNKVNSSEVTFSTNAFTIGDNNTELGIKIENLKDEDVSIEEISIILYNANNEVIESITKDISTTVKTGESKIVNVTLEERFVNVSDVKYKILK